MEERASEARHRVCFGLSIARSDVVQNFPGSWTWYHLRSASGLQIPCSHLYFVDYTNEDRGAYGSGGQATKVKMGAPHGPETSPCSEEERGRYSAETVGLLARGVLRRWLVLRARMKFMMRVN